MSSREDGQRALSEQATQWLLLLQSNELSAQQRVEFVDWLRASPLHIAEMLRIGELDTLLARLTDWKQMPLVKDYQSPVVKFRRRTQAAPARRPPLRLRRRLLATACVAAMMVVGFFEVAHWGEIDLETSSGEQREVTLSDGSVVDLEPDTDLVVHYEKSRRLIYLKRGKATFRDARNPDRPFIVEAARIRVRAVGTEFAVDHGAQGVSVNVIEGRVAISHQAALAFWFWRQQPRMDRVVVSLGPSQAITVTLSGVMSAIRRVPPTPGDSSIADQLVFSNQTVAEVAQRFNVRNRMQIEIVDPELASRKMSGVFDADDPESFVAFIRAVAHVRVQRVGSDRILIVALAPRAADSAR